MPGPSRYTFSQLAEATRKAYPGEFDDVDDQDLAVAVHKAYPGQFDAASNPLGELDLLTPPAPTKSKRQTALGPPPELATPRGDDIDLDVGIDPYKAPGMVEAGNIDLSTRKRTRLKGGGVGTVKTIGITDEDGAQVVIPTIGPHGEQWTDQEAIRHYQQTGEHLGAFDTQANADAYGRVLHAQQLAEGQARLRGPQPPPPPTPPTFLGTEQYEAEGPPLASIPTGSGIGDIGTRFFDALTQATVGRPATVSDPLHVATMGVRGVYGAAKGGAQQLSQDLSEGRVLDFNERVLPRMMESAREEALTGTRDLGTVAQESITPPPEVTDALWAINPVYGAAAQYGVPTAVGFGVSAVTDPLTYAGMGAPKFTRYLGGWMTGRNVIRSIERAGIERLAAEAPGVESRAAAMAGERFGPQTLYEDAAQQGFRRPFSLIPGPPPEAEALGPERQLPTRRIYGTPPGQSAEPGANPLIDELGPELAQRPGEPPRTGLRVEPPPPVGEAPLYTEPTPDYLAEPTVDQLGDTLQMQLERQPLQRGRLTGKAGYRLRRPEAPAPVNTRGGTTTQRNLFRNRPGGPPEVEGRVPLRAPEEAPFSESRPGQGGLAQLREPTEPPLFGDQAAEAARAGVPERPAEGELGTPQQREFYQLLDDAREQGFEGSDQDFAELLHTAKREAKRAGEDYLAEEGGEPQNTYDEAIAFLQKMADAGGLHYDPKSPERGELARIFNATKGVIEKGGRARYAPAGHIPGVRGAVIRYFKAGSKFKQAAQAAFARGKGLKVKENKTPLSLDLMARTLGLDGQDALLSKLNDEVLPAILNGPPKGQAAKADPLKVGMQMLGIKPGERWWDPSTAGWMQAPGREAFGELSDAELQAALRETDMTPEQFRQMLRESEGAPPQYGPPPTVGQPALGEEGPRYQWSDTLKRFLTEEEGSARFPTADERKRARKAVADVLRAGGEKADAIYQELTGLTKATRGNAMSAFQIARSLEDNAASKFHAKAEDIGQRLLAAGEDVSIPGLESVRNVEVPTPREELPQQTFDLTPPPAATPTEGPGLFGDITPEKPKKAGPPSLFDFLSDETGELDLDELRAGMARVTPDTVGAFLKANRALKDLDWYRQARSLYNEGKTFEAHKEILLAQRKIAQSLAGASVRELGNRKDAASIRAEGQAVLKSPTPPWAHPEVREATIVPEQYADQETEAGYKLMQPPRRGPLPDVADMDRVIGNQTASNILETVADTFDTTTNRLLQPYSMETQKPWRKDQGLRYARLLADKILRSETVPGLRVMKQGDVLPLEQVARWFVQKYSQAGRTLGELGNMQQRMMREGRIAKSWVEARFEGIAGGSPEGDTLAPINELASARGTIGTDLAVAQGRKEPTAHLLGKTAPDYLTKDLLWGKTRGAERYAAGQPRGPFNAVENLSRALITSQLPTALRNLWTGVGTYTVGMFDETLTSLLAHLRGDSEAAAAHWGLVKRMAESPFASGTGAVRPWTDTLEAIYQFSADTLATAKGNPLKLRDARRSLAVLENFSRRQDVAQTIAMDFLGDMAGEAETAPLTKGSKLARKILSPEVRNVISMFNRGQEFTVRATVFDSVFRAELDRLGLDTNQLLTHDFAHIAEKVGVDQLDDSLRAATYAALNYTYASGAYPGSITDHVLKFMGRHPLFRTGYPFPRFNLVTAPRFLYDHSPLALFDLAPVVARKLGIVDRPIGRLAKGVAAQNLRTEALPRLATQKLAADSALEAAWTEYKARTQQARSLAKAFRNLERRHLRAQPTMPGATSPIDEQLSAIGEQLGGLYEAQDAARAKILSARATRNEILQTQAQLRSTIRKAQAIHAPTYDQWIARTATGLGMLGAAWVIRSSPGAKGTEWYQYRVKAPSLMGGGEHNLDFRAFAPFSQYLFVADALEDMRTHVDWDQVKGILHNTDPDNDRQYDIRNPSDVYQAIRQSYDGKYLAQDKFQKDFLGAFLSISRAAGTTQSIIDLYTGTQSSEGKVSDAYKFLVGSIGQFLGRFTSPLRQVSDLASAVNEGEGIARIPEEQTPADLLLGPTVANIPGLRQTIPPKVSAVTGEPIASDMPAIRPVTGLTVQRRNEIESDMRDMGLSFADATPRQTHDRQLDNQIARAYHGLLVEVWPEIKGDKEIQALPIGARRAIYQKVFSGLKAAAYGQVYDELTRHGEDEEDAQKKLERPGDRAKRQYWLRTLRKLEAAESPQESDEDGPAPPPELSLDSQESESPQPPPEATNPF